MKQRTALYTLRILYFGMLIGMVLFVGVIYFLSSQSEASIPEEGTGRIFLIASFVLATLCLSLSGYLQKRDLVKIRTLNSITEKFAKYRSVVIRNFAIIEGSALLAIISFYVTHKTQVLVLAALIIIYFLFQYPSTRKIASHIEESPGDIQNLES